MTVQQICHLFQRDFADSFDLVLLKTTVCTYPAVYVYLAGMTDRMLLEQGVIQPLQKAPRHALERDGLAAHLSSAAPLRTVEGQPQAEQAVSDGEVVLWVQNVFYALNLASFDKRAVSEPPTSAVIKGPREGFGEDLAQNITLLRRRIKDRGLAVRKLQVGRLTHTSVAVCWLTPIADSRVVDEIIRRIGAIDIDGVVDSSYIGQLVSDNKNSIYNQFAAQEKPDIVAAKLLEGRVAVVVDGSPIVLTFPYLLLEGFQDSEDYYRGNKRTAFLRVIRLLGMVLAMLLPAVYVAVQEYHYQVIPLKFLITVINAANGVPFPPTVEMFLVLVIFEILNEASVRMPKYVGMALSIVGAIVLGETAVAAGLLSSPTVLVMALSAIGLYTTPDHIGSFGLMRFLFLIMAGMFGFVGLLVSVLVFVCYTVSLSNFGADFAAPIAPFVAADIKDSFIKAPLQRMITRPYSIPNRNHVRIRAPEDNA